MSNTHLRRWRATAAVAAARVGKRACTLNCRKDADRARGTGEVVLTGSKRFDGKSRIEAQMEGMAVVAVARFSSRFLGAACGRAPLMKWEGVSQAPRKPAPAGKAAAPAK